MASVKNTLVAGNISFSVKVRLRVTILQTVTGQVRNSSSGATSHEG